MISDAAVALSKFAACVVLIFYAGRRVAKCGDILAEKTGLGGLWIGVALLAVTTSLPEIFTGVGSSVFVGKPDISIGNIFGANSYNILNIVLLDALNKNTPLLSSISNGQLIIAVLSLFPLTLALAGVFFTSQNTAFSVLNISAWSVLIFIVYLVCVKIIFEYESKNERFKKDEKILSNNYAGVTLKDTIFGFIVSASIIIAAGIWLSYIAEDIATVFGLNLSFVGGLFLGFATTLPEISVSTAALLMGAKEMAVANMLGSNLFNICIITLNDLLYRKGDVFVSVSSNAQAGALTVLLLTLIVISSMIIKPQKKLFGRFSGYSLIILVVFFLGAWLNFIMK